MGMKGLFARVGQAGVRLSDLWALQNRRHFGSTIVFTNCAKQRFLQTKYNSISILHNSFESRDIVTYSSKKKSSISKESIFLGRSWTQNWHCFGCLQCFVNLIKRKRKEYY
jgi:hypothetical protein